MNRREATVFGWGRNTRKWTGAGWEKAVAGLTSVCSSHKATRLLEQYPGQGYPSASGGMGVAAYWLPPGFNPCYRFSDLE